MYVIFKCSLTKNKYENVKISVGAVIGCVNKKINGEIKLFKIDS